MFSRWIFAVLMFIFAASGCRMESDVIAEMKSGPLTRKEFHEWLAARGLQPGKLYEDKENMLFYLRQCGVERLTLETAYAEGFDRTPFFAIINRALYANYLASFYTDEIKRNLRFNERAAEMCIIRLYFRSPSAEDVHLVTGIKNDKQTLARYIIQQLKSGKNFEELARKYSEETSVPSAGTAGVYPVATMEKGIYERVKTISDGEFTTEPVETENSYLVIKILKWHDLTMNNAEKLISDDSRYKALIDYLSEGYIEYIISEKGAELKTESKIAGAFFRDDSEILFCVNGECCTSGEFNHILNLFSFLKTGTTYKNRLLLDESRSAAENVLKERVLSCIADLNGYSSRPDFLNKWMYIKNGTMAGAYKYTILSKLVDITDRDVADAYAENREYYLNAFINTDKSGRGAFIPESNVRKYIRTVLNSKKIAETKKEWESNLLTQNSFRTFPDLL